MKNVRAGLRPGFSLMEIVIAIAIVGVMMSILVPTLANRLEQSKISSAQGTLRGIKSAIDIFHADTGSYPSDLNDLVERPSEERIAAKWASPYLEKLVPDSWNHDYQYERTPQGEHPYELYSFGPKGEDAAEEERISAWN